MLRSTSAGADSEYLKKIYQAFCVLMIFVILGQRFLIPRDNYPDEECNLYRELEIKCCQGSTMGFSLYQFFVKLKKFAIFISVSGIEVFPSNTLKHNFSPYATTNPPILLRVPVDLDTKTALLASVPKIYIFKIKKRLNRKHKNTI